MQVKVFNDNQLAFQGKLSDFLSINENDEWLTDQCKQLETADTITFEEFSGNWTIEKVQN